MRRKCDVMGGQHMNMQRKNMMNTLDCKTVSGQSALKAHTLLS